MQMHPVSPLDVVVPVVLLVGALDRESTDPR
jgi:hypothetical protein